MAAGKDLPLPVIDRVNTVDHGLVRGKYAVGIVVVLLLHQIGAGQTVKQIHKASLCLGHQRIAVRQKKDILYPPGF